MQEIKCPNCGQIFQVDESGYAQIVQQVRDKEFEKELERRERELSQKKEDDLTIARMQQEKSHNPNCPFPPATACRIFNCSMQDLVP